MRMHGLAVAVLLLCAAYGMHAAEPSAAAAFNDETAVAEVKISTERAYREAFNNGVAFLLMS